MQVRTCAVVVQGSMQVPPFKHGDEAQVSCVWRGDMKTEKETSSQSNALHSPQKPQSVFNIFHPKNETTSLVTSHVLAESAIDSLLNYILRAFQVMGVRL